MERIKHHFCWVKTVAGPRKTGPSSEGVAAADMRVAWQSAGGPPPSAGDAEGLVQGSVTPQHAGVPPPKPKSKAAQSSKSAKASVTPKRQHAGVPPASGKSKAGGAGRSGQAAEDKHAGVPPPNPSSASSVMTLVPPPPPVFDPALSVMNGPVPPAQKRMVFAGATLAGAWAFDDLRLTGAAGGEGLRHEFQVVIGDEAAAHAWLIGPEGREWLLDAKAVSLVTFAVIGVY
jgi:hypothetical protein